MSSGLDRRELRERLAEAFPGSSDEYHVVARMAGDLADSGLYERHTGTALSAETVVEHLRDAPVREAGDARVAARWNWWMGSLEIAFGGYERFRAQEWDRERERD